MPKNQFGTVHPEEDAFAFDPAKSGQIPPAAEEDKAGAKPAADPAAAELAAMRAEIADLRRAALEAATRPLTAPAAVAAPARPADVPLDLSGLPDPSTDLPGFTKGLSERVGKVVNTAVDSRAAAANAAAAAAGERQRRFDETWTRFKTQHADLAAHEEIVEGAAKRVVERLRGRGVDAEAYAAQNADDFIDQLATEATKTINKIKGLDADGSDPAANEDAGRAAGLPADRVGGTARGARKPASEKPALFTDELKSIQRELRIF